MSWIITDSAMNVYNWCKLIVSYAETYVVKNEQTDSKTHSRILSAPRLYYSDKCQDIIIQK